MWHIHTMVYYSAIKSNEVLIYAIIWMNLEKINLSENRQSQKTVYYMKCPEEANLLGRKVD